MEPVRLEVNWCACAEAGACPLISVIVTAAVGFASFHGLVLIGDRSVSFPLRAIVVPFASSYEPLLVACGQKALWLSVLRIGSFLWLMAWAVLHNR